MSREQMIELLIEDRMLEWVYAGNDDGLRETLSTGFVGFENYSDKELKEALERLGDGMVEELQGMVEANKNRPELETLPF